MAVHELSRGDARRIAISAQLLERRRPDGLSDVVRGLTLLQIEPTAAVAPSADLVAWSRLGSSYAPRDLVRALDERRLVELEAMVRPVEDLADYRADMAAWPGHGRGTWREVHRRWVAANEACRRDLLARLTHDGPMTARQLPDTCAVRWGSSGWNNNRNVAQMLEFMVRRGEVAVAGRRGRDRLWDIAGRVYPDTPVVEVERARRRRNERRLRALGLARARGPECQVEPADVQEAGEPAVVDGVTGEWRVDPANPVLAGRKFDGRAALLSPFDRLLHDRRRAVELFGFDFQLEIYKPKARRRWGYYALPILYGEELVGKLDATADRKAGVFRVSAVHCDVEFDRAMTAAIDEEIRQLSRWLELELQLPSGHHVSYLRAAG